MALRKSTATYSLGTECDANLHQLPMPDVRMMQFWMRAKERSALYIGQVSSYDLQCTSQVIVPLFHLSLFSCLSNNSCMSTVSHRQAVKSHCARIKKRLFVISSMYFHSTRQVCASKSLALASRLPLWLPRQGYTLTACDNASHPVHIVTLVVMSAGSMKPLPEQGIAPLNFIYACSICCASFTDVYEGHDQSVRGLSDGINPKERLVAKLYLAACCHVFCSSHLEGGGECAISYIIKTGY